MPRGLIFDCDGVLVDSEPLAVAELETLLQDNAVPIDAATIYRQFLGRALDEIIHAAAGYGIDLTPALPGFSERLAARFAKDLRAMPGMAAVLDDLPGARAVASSSAPDRLSLALALTGLDRRFGTQVYSAAQVRHGKPAPDLFLLAARGLGLAPANCVVVEDSPYGIAAARAAGMRVIGFLGGSHAGPAGLAERLAQARPDALIDHAGDLPNTLARLG